MGLISAIERDSKQPIVVARLGVENSRAVVGWKKPSATGRSTEGQEAWSVGFTQEKPWTGRKVSVLREMEKYRMHAGH